MDCAPLTGPPPARSSVKTLHLVRRALREGMLSLASHSCLSFRCRFKLPALASCEGAGWRPAQASTMLCEVVQELRPRGPRLGAVGRLLLDPPAGPQVRAGLTKHLPESCSQAHARHPLSPGGDEGVCRSSACPHPAPTVRVRSQCWEGSRGTREVLAVFKHPCRQAAFQDEGDVLFSRRRGKRRF